MTSRDFKISTLLRDFAPPREILSRKDAKAQRKSEKYCILSKENHYNASSLCEKLFLIK